MLWRPGTGHKLLVTGGGSVFGWGNNGNGEATPPAGLAGVVAIAAGGNHSLALKSDGTVVGWGSNGSGQARPPAGLSGVVALAAGGSNSLAVVGANGGRCLVDVSAQYGAGTLGVRQAFGSPAAASAYRSVLVTAGGTAPLTGPLSLGATVPPEIVTSAVALAPAGYVAVSGWLRLQDGTVCSDTAVVNTGGSGLTADELRERLRRSGLEAPAF